MTSNRDLGKAPVVLRPLQPDDEKPVYELLSDERVIRYMLFPRFTGQQARAFVERFQKAGPTGSPPQVVLAIQWSEAPSLIGLCGVVLDPAGHQGEVWYLLRPDLWGRGIVTEAARKLVAYAFDQLTLHRLWASCLPENPASARVLEKLGFRQEGFHRQNLLIHGVWRDSHTYAILRAEWAGAPS